MTRQEAIKLAFNIKENPKTYTDYSSYLYDAVGLVKRERDAGATFAAMKLVEEIRNVTNGQLSDFCKRKIDIIENAHLDRMARALTQLADARERLDYQAAVRDCEAALLRRNAGL